MKRLQPRLDALVARLPLTAVQYLKFGIVGGLATAFHSVLFVLFIEVFGAEPMLANTLAFACAVVVSYLGNYRWTFGATRRSWASFLKFAVVSLIGFALNSLAIFIIVEAMALSYLWVLPFMVGIVPIVVFALNRGWTFGEARRVG
ncbi:GtrA family protein [Afifella aestuarii]|uniref:GtrA family protein n=1 Tax=Afifella aestuarii TaxID=1909496 RepID=UPI000FE3328F|nr:GtrA family protein [Afifella aestuarii]